MFPVLGEHVGTDRNDLEPAGAGVADHVLDQGHRRAGPAHAGRRFGVVGADQRWTSNGEKKFGFAVDTVDPGDIAAARPGYALLDVDGDDYPRSIASNFIGLLTSATAAAA